MNEHTDYQESDLLRLARRVNNPRRSYLLVNPLQGKHIPVDPHTALTMMRALGRAVRAAHPGLALVIGFSETATAVGAAVAAELGGESVYLQTTREPDTGVRGWIDFSEEHSHASEQRLCRDGFDARVEACDYILLVDDEISTGKTILNITAAIRRACPAAADKPFVVASLLNRVEADRREAFARAGIGFIWLLHPETEDFEARVQSIPVREAEPPAGDCRTQPALTRLDAALPDPRRGVRIGAYLDACGRAVEAVLRQVCLRAEARVLVLGTEEFMFPALYLAERIRAQGLAASVRFHATTRSPIGISGAEGYPIVSGVRLPSLYDPERTTYLYDLAAYDRVIVFSDAAAPTPKAAGRLQCALERSGCERVQFFFGDHHV